MKAIGYTQSLPCDHPEALIDIELPKPAVHGRDLLVEIYAIGVNPVDYKIRQNVAPIAGQWKVIGWDAVGRVVAVGDEVANYQCGDWVFYAGDLNRPGCNAEFQLVDERLVGKKPARLSNAEAAALPLTAITAWELLFDRLEITQGSPGQINPSDDVILVVGASGGVGSILIQLAKALTGATVIATASRPESKRWLQQLGADYIIDHSQPLAPQVAAVVADNDLAAVSHVASLNATDQYLSDYVELLAPFGKLALIDDPQSLDIMSLKRKSLSVHWEFMFTHSMFQTSDMDRQQQLLNRVSQLIDEGFLQTTVAKNLGAITAANLRTAHQELESRRVIGKIVLERQ